MLETITQRAFRKGALLAYGALALVVASCQIVADIQSQRLDPPPPDGGTCTFPDYLNYTGPQVRVANLVPTSDVVDICMRPSGSGSWGRPLVFNGGSTCALQPDGSQGFAYGDVSYKFNAPSGKIDVKLVAAAGSAGGNPCSAPGLTEADGLTLPTDSVTTLARIGSSSVPQQIVALPEANSSTTTAPRVRFVHAMPGLGPLDFGATTPTPGTTPHLPASITAPLLDKPVAFGTAPTQGQKPVGSFKLDSHGYETLIEAEFYLVAQLHGQTKGLLLESVSKAANTYSLFAIGVAGDNLHPVRGLLCDEGAPPDGQKEHCTLSDLPTISVDVWNPAYYGPNSPFYFARDSQAVLNSIGARDADFMCLTEVDSSADQSAITGAVQGAPNPFPYVYAGPAMTLDTPFSSPKDQNGNVPPAPTTPPCGGSVPQADVDAAIQCMENSCSNMPGNPSGHLNQSTDCLNTCAGQIIQVQQDSVACYDCLLTYVASGAESYASTEQRCLNNLEPPLAFEGLNNTMIASRYKFVSTDAFVLPSTLYRRTVLYAQVQLEDQTVDFYCGFLTSTGIAADFAYTGNYGGPGCDPHGDCWSNEQTFQAKQLAQWVQSKSGNRPAIIMGDWRAGREVDVQGADGGPVLMSNGQAEQILAPLVQPTMDVLFNAFTPVTPSSWTPQCNYCPTAPNPYNTAALTNPYNDTSSNFFTSQPFLYKWPGASTAAVDMKLVYTDPMAVPAPANGPASPYYGVNIHVLRPNASGM